MTTSPAPDAAHGSDGGPSLAEVTAHWQRQFLAELKSDIAGLALEAEDGNDSAARTLGWTLRDVVDLIATLRQSESAEVRTCAERLHTCVHHRLYAPTE